MKIGNAPAFPVLASPMIGLIGAHLSDEARFSPNMTRCSRPLIFKEEVGCVRVIWLRFVFEEKERIGIHRVANTTNLDGIKEDGSTLFPECKVERVGLFRSQQEREMERCKEEIMG